MITKYYIQFDENKKAISHSSLVTENEEAVSNSGFTFATLQDDPAYNELTQDLSDYKYKQLNNAWVIYKEAVNKVIPELSLSDLKAQKIRNISESFKMDIAFTDDEYFFYQKYKELNKSSTIYDKWYEYVLAFWQEAYTENINKKRLIEASNDRAIVSAITYSPTHAKTSAILKTPTKNMA